eukprot:COSAG06_NODE_4076_length_4599_cov_1.768222_1_plen_76_part_10
MVVAHSASRLGIGVQPVQMFRVFATAAALKMMTAKATATAIQMERVAPLAAFHAPTINKTVRRPISTAAVVGATRV